MRCMLCRKKTETLSVHGLCEDCEKQFDFEQGEPYVPAEDEGTAGKTAKRILITSACAIALILFMVWMIPLLFSLLQPR